MAPRLGAHFELKRLARKFGQARLSSLVLFAAGKLLVEVLDPFEQSLRLGDRTGGVARWPSSARLSLAARRALLAVLMSLARLCSCRTRYRAKAFNSSFVCC